MGDYSVANLEGQITKDYHRVEKGLSLPEPRRPFGRDVQERLEALAPSGPESAMYVDYSRSALAALEQWNAGGDIENAVSPTTAFATWNIDFDTLYRVASDRHSVRNFNSSRVVDDAAIDQAVKVANLTPSVCNRQASRVHSYTGVRVSQMLALQNGNAGFRGQVQNLLVVTVDAGMFGGAGERNQRWIDGGLYAMSLVWGLHGIGVSSCMLNWSMGHGASEELRRAGDIPANEDIVCLIAIGFPAEGVVRTARSPLRDVAEVRTKHS